MSETIFVSQTTQTAETILVIDDDTDILALLEMSLASDGFHVITASNGISGLQLAKADQPDLILLDVMMPQMDGLQVIEKLKADTETNAIPVLWLTAKTQTEDKLRGLEIGGDDYITKPFDLREVTARINTVLGRTRPVKYINPLINAMGESFSEAGVAELGSHLQAAAEIQLKLLPEKPPTFSNFDFATMFRSSTSVSGDFYDFIPLSDTHLGIVLGDVKGHGIPAALLMVMIQTASRLLSNEEDSWEMPNAHLPATILKRINTLLFHNTDLEQFATMVYGILEIDTGRFTYSNGGHCPPIHFITDSENSKQTEKNRNRVELLETGGMLIGAFDIATFSSETCLLSPGDVLLLYTDGVTETEGQTPNDFYGEERLIDCFSKNLTLSAESLCDVLQTELMEFSGTTQLKDDRAVVVIKRTTDETTPT